MLLDGRTRIFCFESDVIAELNELPRDSFVARDAIKPIEDLEQFVCHNPDGYFSISFRLRGGKGGFGTLLRSFRINKSTNQLMCRDLSGRRLADIEEEKKLKKWVENSNDREKEKESKKKAKYEKLRAATQEKPKHDFNDPDYINTREAILDKTDDAFDAGFAHRRKRKPVKEEIEAEQSESEEEEEDADVPGCSTSFKPKRAKVRPLKTSDIKEEREEGSSGSEEKSEERSVTPQPEPVIVEEKKVEVVQPPIEEKKEEEKKKVYEKPKDIPTDFDPIDLDSIKDVHELESLGLYHLKHGLESRGLKCGGSLEERAARLFSVKGLKKEEYPKAIVAPPPKNKNKK